MEFRDSINTTNVKGINWFYKLTLLNYFFLRITDLKENTLIYWSSIGLVLIAFMSKLVFSGIILTNYLFWIYCFDSFVILSSLWALDFQLAFQSIKDLFVLTIVFSFLSMLIKSKNNYYEILKIYVYANILSLCFILLKINKSTIGIVRLGFEALGEGWNANSIGMNMALSAFMSVILLNAEKRKYKKLVYSLLIILFSLTVILTGSRKAIFILIFTLSLYLFKTLRIGAIYKIIIITVGILLFAYLIMNIQMFYNVLGKRIETFIALFTGYGKVDRSARLRMDMIRYGLFLFLQKPILGYGINNFRELYGNKTGLYTYSHNNYIELLTGIGLLGTFIYYFSYFYIMKKTIFKREQLLTTSFILILTLFIIEAGLVSYNGFLAHFLINLGFSVINITKRENDLSECKK